MRWAAPTGCEMAPHTDLVPARIRTCVDLPLQGPSGPVPSQVFTFTGLPDAREHLVVALGNHRRPRHGVPLVRVHSECLTGDVLGSRRCDCGAQLEESIGRIVERGGFLVYLRQEGRGIGLYAKLDAYKLQEYGLDTFQANRRLGFADDERDYRPAAAMLAALGVRRVDLLTGNPQKAQALRDAGIVVRTVTPTSLHETAENARYLDAKRDRGFVFDTC